MENNADEESPFKDLLSAALSESGLTDDFTDEASGYTPQNQVLQPGLSHGQVQQVPQIVHTQVPQRIQYVTQQGGIAQQPRQIILQNPSGGGAQTPSTVQLVTGGQVLQNIAGGSTQRFLLPGSSARPQSPQLVRVLQNPISTPAQDNAGGLKKVYIQRVPAKSTGQSPSGAETGQRIVTLPAGMSLAQSVPSTGSQQVRHTGASQSAALQAMVGKGPIKVIRVGGSNNPNVSQGLPGQALTPAGKRLKIIPVKTVQGAGSGQQQVLTKHISQGGSSQSQVVIGSSQSAGGGTPKIIKIMTTQPSGSITQGTNRTFIVATTAPGSQTSQSFILTSSGQLQQGTVFLNSSTSNSSLSRTNTPVNIQRMPAPLTQTRGISQGNSPAPIVQTRRISPAPVVQTQGRSPAPLVQTQGRSPAPVVQTQGRSLAPLVQTQGRSPAQVVQTQGRSPASLVQTQGVLPATVVQTQTASPATVVKTPGVPSTTVVNTQGISPANVIQNPGISPPTVVQSPGISPTTVVQTPGISPTTVVQTPGISPATVVMTPGISPATVVQTPGISSTVVQTPVVSPATLVQTQEISPATPEISQASVSQNTGISPATVDQTQEISPATVFQSERASPTPEVSPTTEVKTQVMSPTTAAGTPGLPASTEVQRQTQAQTVQSDYHTTSQSALFPSNLPSHTEIKPSTDSVTSNTTSVVMKSGVKNTEQSIDKKSSLEGGKDEDFFESLNALLEKSKTDPGQVSEKINTPETDFKVKEETNPLDPDKLGDVKQEYNDIIAELFMPTVKDESQLSHSVKAEVKAEPVKQEVKQECEVHIKQEELVKREVAMETDFPAATSSNPPIKTEPKEEVKTSVKTSEDKEPHEEPAADVGFGALGGGGDDGVDFFAAFAQLADTNKKAEVFEKKEKSTDCDSA